MKYTLRIPFSSIVDCAGNTPRNRKDTTAFTFSVSFLPATELCQSLSGAQTCPAFHPAGTWVLSYLKGGSEKSTGNTQGEFRFESIPGGKATMRWFRDDNNDGIPSPGRLFPFVAPEPYHAFPDTVEARARWDIEGVKLEGCSPCQTGKGNTISTPASTRDSANVR